MIEFNVTITSITVLGFFLLLVLAGFRLRSRQATVFHLTVYLILALSSNLSRLLAGLNFTSFSYEKHLLVAEFTLLAMILAFGGLTLVFLKKEKNHVVSYWSSALIILILWMIFTANVWDWGPSTLMSSLNNPIMMSSLAWIISLASVNIALGAEFRKSHSTQFLNRLRYWLTATALLTVSGFAYFFNPIIFYLVGWLLILTSSILISYVILSHDTRDLNLFVGRVLYHACVGGAIAAILYLSIAATIMISRYTINNTYIFFWSIILALLLTISIPFFKNTLDKIFTKIIFGKQFHEEKEIIKYYSQSISRAMDIQRLADTIINLMIETLNIKTGLVFVNERKERNSLSLRPVSSVGVGSSTNPGQISIDSPFVDHFRKDNRVLNQYDIDVRPQFGEMREEEREWLSSLKMELYVPIMRQNEFVGLLAFGPRSGGISYTGEDVDLMIALADQAVLAMDSARLFEQLTTTSQEIGSLSEQLAGLDENKADFLSIASHELRTPLTQIHGYARILADFSDEELQNPAQVRSMLTGIVKGSDRLKEVVDIMFDVSEAHIGEMTLFASPVNLESVIDHAVRPYLSALDERRIAFAKNGLEEAPTVEADGTRLVQAFENLIGNAVKYTPDGGMVSVSSRSIITDDLGQAVEIVVADTGIGIDPEYHQRIFEKFFRVDNPDHHSTGSTKFKGAGPGLGLTLVRGIAKAHGGNVWVESAGHDEVNYPGSKFFFVIPLRNAFPTSTEEPEKQSLIETVHWRSKDLKPTE